LNVGSYHAKGLETAVYFRWRGFILRPGIVSQQGFQRIAVPDLKTNLAYRRMERSLPVAFKPFGKASAL
jgi:hypothetical protein